MVILKQMLDMAHSMVNTNKTFLPYYKVNVYKQHYHTSIMPFITIFQLYGDKQFLLVGKTMDPAANH